MAKDSAWSWVIVVGAFVGNFMETGIVKSFGVLLPELCAQFTAPTWVIGLAISLMPGFGAVTCIVAAGLSRMYSSRFVIVSFGVISSIGLLLCSVATVIPMLVIGLILVGFASGAIATTISIVPLYFDKHFGIANSIFHAGLSLGVMIMPLLTQFLFDMYGWRGTLLIFTGLNMHLALNGALLRPLQHPSAVHFTPTTDPDNIDMKTKTDKGESQLIKTVIYIFDLDLFKSSECMSLWVGNIGLGYYYTGWLIYLVPHAEDLGFSPYAASALATAGGLGNLAGSCAFPLVLKVMSTKSMLFVFHVIAFISLVVDPIFSMGPVYIGLISAAFTVNFAYATWGCALYMEIVAICDEARIRSFTIWLYVAYGIGSILSGFVSGWFFDQYGNFTASFLLLSIAPILSLIPMIVQSVRRLKKESNYTALRYEDHENKN